MGNLYLTNLADWLYDAGLAVVEYGGWQNRARGSGGYDAYPLCVMWHHTASPATWDGQKDADYCAVGDEDAPLANLYIDRSGAVWVLAAGATNTNGKGKSITFSRGTCPSDSMNSYALGVEMGNDGIGERWPVDQINSAFVVNNVCNQMFGNLPDDLSTHHFYAPDRKIDPATTNVEGPWVPTSCTSSGTWDRSSVQREASTRAQVAPPDMEGTDDMATPELWQLPDNPAVYVVDFNSGTKSWLPSEQSVIARMNLHDIKGFDSAIKIQNDRNMFRAYGPIVTVRPDGVDEWGVPE